MCGIAGWLPGPGAGRRSREDLEVTGRAMAAAVAHRGPDGEGTWVAPGATGVLAHRRLAVVGLGAPGAQPMTSASGRTVLTYNGELYDASALGRRLEGLGTTFRGTSDTEVLVEAIDRWGVEDTLARVDGMFAFAAWDRDRGRVTLARDRMGEKPLCYAALGGGFGFASEVRALHVLPGFPSRPDPDAVALYLRFKYVPAPFTAFPGVWKLPPGCTLAVDVTDPAAVASPQPYWSVLDTWEAGGRDPLVDDGEALDRLDRTLAASVEGRLRADVPLGAFLSGGIDSSLVATLAAEQGRGALRTFTIGSDDPDHDEAAQARELAARLGAEHTELVVTAADALREVPDLARTWDEPYGDSSALPTTLVARLARRDVTVVLSGDGGDELFGGYNRHVWLPATWDRAGRVPAPLRRAAARGLEWPAPARWDRAARLVPEARRPRLVGLKVGKVAQVLGAGTPAEAYGRLVSHWDLPAEVVRGAHEPVTLTHDPARWPALGSLAAQMMAVDAATYLPDDVLVKVDRATMAVGLEARVPMLGREVVELAARLGPGLRIRDGRGKWALRQLLLRRHPRELVERPKSGFGVPIARWLRGPLRPWAEDLLAPGALAATGLLRPEPVRRAWRDHLAGRRDASYEIWDVLMLQSWLDATSTDAARP
ncbi:asparagine synthase (glutamine-hydrolyzing) [Iamia majanohamensis]|uniref:asparagine synthase (glutamine-hydrolyzing) n=1 Tax=Iamia majanohamensis TaxID=467976 RepID=A0AAE9Y3K1_9ACTN|nr:asparagine synthase (glutamine-hydrolyzing) [Iamia majanohamensis]WCO65855.1 asparagine synthase (glutamine-hydrolyzing) [Iamia majanohamensis]